MEKLIELNSDQEARDLYGDNPYVFAERNGHTLIVENFSFQFRMAAVARHKWQLLYLAIGTVASVAVFSAVATLVR